MRVPFSVIATMRSVGYRRDRTRPFATTSSVMCCSVRAAILPEMLAPFDNSILA